VRVSHDVPLAPLTTLGVGGAASRVIDLDDERELPDALREIGDGPLLVLGGGSNLVVRDAGFAGTVLRLATTRVQIDAGREDVVVDADAGVVWDDLVAQVVGERFTGVECLAGIPGLVGATPMQNVGAYGQEVGDVLDHVRAYDRELQRVVEIPKRDCELAYRHSKFRGSTRWIILGVRLWLGRDYMATGIRYAELATALGIPEGHRAPPGEVRAAVLALRRGKGMVVDAADPDTRSAGSFFTNPIIPTAIAMRLPPAVPRWPQPDGRVKLAAAWLIEHSGFAKGLARGHVGISTKHALALVARPGATAGELLALADDIRAAVRVSFGIDLAMEPVVV
jgi:UDP-N-acetylmuramate dehydrogenase